MTVLRASGEQAQGNGNDGEVIFKDVTVSFGDIVTTADAGEYRLPSPEYEAIPFSLIAEGMKNNMQFTGADTFLDKNVFKYHHGNA